MRKLYTTKLISKPEMKFDLVLDYTLPSTRLKSTQAEIQNDGSLGLVISLKTRSRRSHYQDLYSSLFRVVTIHHVGSFTDPKKSDKKCFPVLDYNSKVLKKAERCFHPPFMFSPTVASAPSPASLCGTHLYMP